MTAIVVRRYASASEAEQGSREDRKMFITSEDRSLYVVVPYAPREITYENRARATAQIERPGLSPILAVGAMPLPTLAYELTFADPDPDVDVESDLLALERIAGSGDRVIVNFGPAEAGLWRVTAFSYTSVNRHPDTQAITQATATIELTRASDFAVRVGPVTGGAGTPSKSGGGKKHSYYGGGTYKVKRGDTLGKISNRFYKTPKYWRKVADANKIRHPKRSAKLKAGRTLKIPKVRK